MNSMTSAKPACSTPSIDGWNITSGTLNQHQSFIKVIGHWCEIIPVFCVLFVNQSLLRWACRCVGGYHDRVMVNLWLKTLTTCKQNNIPYTFNANRQLVVALKVHNLRFVFISIWNCPANVHCAHVWMNKVYALLLISGWYDLCKRIETSCQMKFGQLTVESWDHASSKHFQSLPIPLALSHCQNPLHLCSKATVHISIIELCIHVLNPWQMCYQHSQCVYTPSSLHHSYQTCRLLVSYDLPVMNHHHELYKVWKH